MGLKEWLSRDSASRQRGSSHAHLPPQQQTSIAARRHSRAAPEPSSFTVDRAPHQSESGYYFDEYGIDDNQSDGDAHSYPSQQQPRGSQYHYDPRWSNGGGGEPIEIHGLGPNMATTAVQPPPRGEYHADQRASITAEEVPRRSSLFGGIRFSLLGGGRSQSNEDNNNRLSQLAVDVPKRDKGEVVMKGWLEKCGQQFKTWNMRFFVLFADGLLEYYADEQLQRQKGSLNVGFDAKADISMQSNLIDKKNVFLIATTQRNLMISAPSQKMMTKWIAKLHAVGATPSEPWDPSKKTVKFFVRDSEIAHEWKRYDDPTSYIHMEGCLLKRGHVNKNWKNRFFRVERGELRYYTENQDQLKGSVPLKDTVVSPGMTQAPDGRKNYFVLASKDGKFEMHLNAPNEQAMHRWIEALQEAQTALGNRGEKGTVSGLALVVKRAEEIPLAKQEVVYESLELINVELERRMESLIVVACRAGTVPVGSQLIAVGSRSILRESYTASRNALRAAPCPLQLHFLLPPYKRGELIKKSRSGFENWKRRVIIVTNGEIQYYKQVVPTAPADTGLKHRKSFPLYGCYLNLIQLPGRDFCIIVARSPSDKLVLQARNEEERIEWASVIYCSIRMVSQGVTAGHIENLQLEVARDPTTMAPRGGESDRPLPVERL